MCLLFTASALQAQVRYLDPMFDVDLTDTVVYATNFNVQLNMQTPLTADVYQPVNDEEELRPVVVLFHTGNFLPQYFNGSAYGGKKDSVNVEILSRLVERGYVGMSATYRFGWNPLAEIQSIRTGSLLQAVYRASQDAHAMARYLRKSVAEDGNPFRVDTNRIVFYGVGSGGYLVQAHNFLDDVDQIALNDQFYDQDGNVLIQVDDISNVEGTIETPRNTVNHPGYSSDVALTVNLGGALGDSLWIDGADNEAPFFATHSATDPFAPFYYGLVTVPTTPPRAVVNVPGSNLVVTLANERGVNDVLAPANAVPLPEMFGSLATTLNATVAAYKQVQYQNPVPGSSTDVFPLGVDNLWTILRQGDAAGSLGVTGATWNWFNEPVLRGTIAFINSQVPDANIDADRIIAGEPLTNPNFNDPDAAKAEIDTIMAHFYPRAWYALDLESLVSTEDVVSNAAVGLEIYPNPVASEFTVAVAETEKINAIRILDMEGRVLRTQSGLNTSQMTLDRQGLPTGLYIVQIMLERGMTARKVVLK
ncbi:hypothetical protein A3850_016170 [Lewinella sp. 4G2]|nr:hypothetical protein A3850_016170 [Lewinella sp. 4G2]